MISLNMETATLSNYNHQNGSNDSVDSTTNRDSSHHSSTSHHKKHKKEKHKKKHKHHDRVCSNYFLIGRVIRLFTKNSCVLFTGPVKGA